MPVTPRGELAPGEKAAVELFQRVSPSVVQVVGASPEAALGNMSEGVHSGTGFVWDAAGHIVTNNHVVQGASEIAIRFASGRVAPAEVMGVAPTYDLAVLRLRSVQELPPPVMIGRSADLQVGQAAFAIGNPFGFDQSLTTGVISALKRRLPTSGGREISGVVQTDAAVNPGNSGGPLLDSAGRVIGVNTAIFSPSGANAGVGFAIPIDVVNRIAPQLIKNGRVPTPGIGIIAADEATSARLGVEGVIVVRSSPGSPAARAGLRGIDLANGMLGDVIVGVDGRKIRRLADLTDALEEAGVGKQITLQVVRDGLSRTLRVDVADVENR
jgi:2-alkenal reductase